ncbi:MAG: hypothetical protein JNK37_07910 [Verrucomicrobiales bacterium]|nr:hypothetical protein [Verrucomicrobiales bacterium]
MMRRPIQSRRTHEIEGPAMRLAGIGGANRLDRVGGAGRTLVEGTVDEPSTVTVNGEPAPLRPLSGGASFLYSKELNLGPGEKRLEVEATDPNGNVARRSYTVSVGGVERTLAHDLNGNVTQEAVAGGKTRVYEWDAINRLTAIQSDVVPVAGSWRTEYTYDGQSRRVRAVEKTWNPAGAGSWVVASDHRYLWMGTKICQKRDATGAIPQVRYYDGGERRTVGTVNTDYHYTRDHLGSIREVVTTTGAVYLRYDYTPWGERIKIGGTASAAEGDAFEWGFTGHHYHAKSGLHLALYRAYDANLGRWLSEDPLGEAGGVNLYGYVGNGPAGAWDPLGLLDLFVGIEGDFVGLLGGSGAFGLVLDLFDPLSSGVFCTFGGAGGVNVDLDIYGGVAWREAEGTGFTVDGGLPAWTLGGGAIFDDQGFNGLFVGGWGPGGGLSAGGDLTSTYSAYDFLKDLLPYVHDIINIAAEVSCPVNL